MIRVTLRAATIFVLGLWSAWGTMILAFGLTDAAIIAGPLVIIWNGIFALGLRPRLRGRCWWAAVAVSSLLVAAIWILASPSHERVWVLEQAHTPTVELVGDVVVIANVRNARYRSTTDFDLHWETRSYDLGSVRSVDFVVEPFAGDWRGPAHTFLSWGFSDGRYLGISAEIRREKDEEFSPWAGLVRRFELVLVVGDEQDLVALRLNHRNNPVYIYRSNATPEQARQLLFAFCRRANEIGEQPEFYNTLSNNCVTNIMRPVAELMGREIGLDLRTIFPGYSDGVALEFGWIDHDGDLESARERYRVKPLEEISDSTEWSRRLRER